MKAIDNVIDKVKKIIRVYYDRKNLNNLLSLGAMYNWIYGGRNNGKSYAVKTYLLEDAWKNKRYFGLLFRREKLVSKMMRYFDDAVCRDDGYEFIKDMTNGAADGITIKAGKIYFTLEGKNVAPCGYIFFLEKEQDYKSEVSNYCYNIIYEEVISRDGYLIGELEKFDSLISTVFRSRENCKVFLISNLVSRVIPYRSGWGLTGMDRQKPDTIDLYKKEFYDASMGQIVYIDIAVERCKETSTQQFALSKKGQNSANGQWEVEECLKIDKEELNKCIEMYNFVVTFSGSFFFLRFMRDSKQNYFIYCERKTTDIQPKTRVIGDIAFINNLYTPNFTPLIERERFVFNLIKMKKVYFGDDLTAADFWISYNSLLK